MDLATTWMGLSLENPLVPSASPLTRDVDTLRKLEDAGAGAVVLYSLFEEQIEFEARELEHYLEFGAESYAEAVDYFPRPGEYARGPQEYLDFVRAAKEALGIPVVASLNAQDPGAWTDWAGRIAEAGADALELNVYWLPTDPETSCREIEARYVEVVGEVAAAVDIPVAVKMHPFFTNPAEMARRLARAGARGLALFNRFYQPDIDPENLEVVPELQLSDSWDLRLPLRWVAILHGRVGADLSLTGGVLSGRDAVKALMAGARVVHLCSALLRYGIPHLRRVREELVRFLEEHGYGSVDEVVGTMSQRNCPDPGAFERANYIRVLQSFG